MLQSFSHADVPTNITQRIELGPKNEERVAACTRKARSEQQGLRAQVCIGKKAARDLGIAKLFSDRTT